MTSWRTRGSATVYENPWIRVREDGVDRPDGSAGIYGVVEVRKPAVFVVPMTDADEVVLVEVDRTPPARLVEVPAGGSDGEDLLLAAQRELREETGLVADSWQQVGSMSRSTGSATRPSTCTSPAACAPSDEPLEQDEEGITAVRTVPWAEVLEDGRGRHDHRRRDVAALMYAASPWAGSGDEASGLGGHGPGTGGADGEDPGYRQLDHLGERLVVAEHLLLAGAEEATAEAAAGAAGVQVTSACAPWSDRYTTVDPVPLCGPDRRGRSSSSRTGSTRDPQPATPTVGAPPSNTSMRMTRRAGPEPSPYGLTSSGPVSTVGSAPAAHALQSRTMTTARSPPRV